jgi:hypothetical protein
VAARSQRTGRAAPRQLAEACSPRTRADAHVDR